MGRGFADSGECKREAGRAIGTWQLGVLRGEGGGCWEMTRQGWMDQGRSRKRIRFNFQSACRLFRSGGYRGGLGMPHLLLLQQSSDSFSVPKGLGLGARAKAAWK